MSQIRSKGALTNGIGNGAHDMAGGAATGGMGQQPSTAQMAMAATALQMRAVESQATSSLAAHWELQTPQGLNLPESAKLVPSLQTNGLAELALKKFPDKSRTRVPEPDFAPGGKYRSIVKLFLRYKGSPPDEWDIATGWLINPDLVVTAGHCAYAWRDQGGALAEVKAYIGYKGRKMMSDPSVEVRKGRSVVTTSQYIQDGGNRSWDAAFIRLDQEFSGVTPIPWMSTSMTGDSNIGVVGYPGDLEDGGEKGARMYEMFLPTKWDLKSSKFSMLQYWIDTFGGNSGSPVLTSINGIFTAIGIHTYGGDPNSATVIGDYGIYFPDYLQAFLLEGRWQKRDGFPTGKVRFVTIPPRISVNNDESGVKSSSLNNVAGKPGQVESLGTTPIATADAEAFNFSNILKTAAGAVKSIDPNIISMATTAVSTLGGPIGVAVGSIANMAVGIVSSCAESSKTESWNADIAIPGTPERAIMAQAALTSFTALMRSPDPQAQALSQEITSIAQVKMKELKPQYERAAVLAAPVIKDYALRVALDEVRRLKDTVSYEKSKTAYVIPTATPRPESMAKTDVFAEKFIAATAAKEDATESKSFASLGNLVRRAATASKPLLLKGAVYIAADQALQHVQAKRKSAGLPAWKSGGDIWELGACQAIAGEAILQTLPEVDFDKLNDMGFVKLMAELMIKSSFRVLKAYPSMTEDIKKHVDELREKEVTEGTTVSSGVSEMERRKRAKDLESFLDEEEQDSPVMIR